MAMATSTIRKYLRTIHPLTKTRLCSEPVSSPYAPCIAYLRTFTMWYLNLYQSNPFYVRQTETTKEPEQTYEKNKTNGDRV